VEYRWIRIGIVCKRPREEQPIRQMRFKSIENWRGFDKQEIDSRRTRRDWSYSYIVIVMPGFGTLKCNS
jgi:hypothetical protein